MSSYNIWYVKCLTENAAKQWILNDTDSDPTTCPSNSAHTIDAALTRIIKTVDDNIVTIREETDATGGHFSCATLKINATQNTTSSSSIYWPHPVSAMSFNFITGTGHCGDRVSMSVGKNTIIGVITAGVAGATAANWTSSNYTAGQYVTYTHPTLGPRIYTCILNTVSNEVPTNAVYWQHGLSVSVSSTVTANTSVGYYLNLFDGAKTHDLGRIIKLDKNNNKVYVEKEPSLAYSPASPTYVRQTAYVMKNYDIGESAPRQIGDSKIGGAYIPANVFVTADYENNSDTDKVLIGHVEYLY